MLLESKDTRKEIVIPQRMIKSYYQDVGINQLTYDSLLHFYNTIESDRLMKLKESITKQNQKKKKHFQAVPPGSPINQMFFLMS